MYYRELSAGPRPVHLCTTAISQLPRIARHTNLPRRIRIMMIIANPHSPPRRRMYVPAAMLFYKFSKALLLA